MVPDHLTPPFSDPRSDDESPSRPLGAAEQPQSNGADPNAGPEAAAHYGIFWLDLTGRVTRWTKACERVFRRDRSDSVGELFRDLFVEEDRSHGIPEMALLQARETGSWDGVGWQLTGDGGRFWAATSVTLVSTPNGIDIGHMVVTRNLSLLADEEPLAPDATRLVSLGRVATEVSHDVSNILTAIRGFAGLLERKLPSGGSSHQVWYELVKACDRGSELTQKVLSVARVASDEAGVVSVVDIVRDMEPLLRQVLPGRIVLTLSLEDGLLPVRGSSTDIELALLNLVVNARDAIAGDGTIVVSVGRQWHPGAARDRIVLSVRDSGSGMTAETKERVFERFFTTKAPGEGTGIGMAVVRDSVRAAGGSIEIESKPGAGTVVKLLLSPAFQACSPHRDPAEDVGRGDSRRQVLVCCGSEILCDCAADLLAREGFAVTRARSAEEARRLCEGDASFDVAVVDLVLADASGPELVAEVRKPSTVMPTIFISDRSATASGDLADVGLTDRVMFTPFSPEELLDTVLRLIPHEDDERAAAVH